MNAVIRFLFLLAAIPAAIVGTVLTRRALRQVETSQQMVQRLRGTPLYARSHMDRLHAFHTGAGAWVWIACALAVLAFAVVAYAWITSFHHVMQWVGMVAASVAIAAALGAVWPAGDAYAAVVTCFHSGLDPCPVRVSADNAAWACGYLSYSALVGCLALGHFLSERAQRLRRSQLEALQQPDSGD